MASTALKTLPLFLLACMSVQAADIDLDNALQGFDDDPSPSVENSALDEVLGGFDDTPSTTVDVTATESNKPWQLGGSFTLASAWNIAHEKPVSNETDYRGLSRLRGKLNLEFDYDFSRSWRSHAAGYAYHDLAYQLNGRDEYHDDVLDEYESEVELGEAWLQGKLSPSSDLKLGRQIVVWGKSDNIRITDIINPMDNREPGMVDIEDLRLPLTMARYDYYIGDWGITALAIPEIRFNKLPPFGSDFYPSAVEMPDEEIPGDAEYALAANGIFSGWDLSLYWADVYDDTPHIAMTASGPEQQHSRLAMLGAASNLALGNWLLKAEAAHFDGIEFGSLTNEEFSRTDTLIGMEYSGIQDTTLSLEVANRHLHDLDTALLSDGVKEEQWQTALRYQGEYMHARLQLLAVITAFGEQLDEGGFGRYSATYDLADGINITGGLVSYLSGDHFPLGQYSDNDRIFAELKYSF